MKSDSKNDKPVVGITTYANGEKDVFTNADRFIKTIAEELPERSSSGFAFRVMNADPATRKAIDDLVYNEYGEQNPHDLNYYKQNERRDNMNLTIRPLETGEKNYTYTQDADILQASGCIGHLRVDMDSTGTGFFSSWDNHTPELNDAVFKKEFEDVIDSLRYDERYGGMLKNRSSLAAYCYARPDSVMTDDNRNFGFRVDIEQHSYMLRLNPNRGEYAVYCYAYDRAMLEQHLTQAQQLTVLMVEPGKEPYPKKIGLELADLQREVGGDIEVVYPFEERVGLVCGESAKLEGLPLNRALRDEDGNIYDVVAGNFFIVGLGEEDFCSLKDSDIKKCSEIFKTPEAFMRMGGKLVVLPVEQKQEKRPSVLEQLKKTPPQSNADKKKANDMEL